MEQHQDEHITCAECGTTFVFTAAEASNFASKGLEPPKRCFECRRARRAQRGGAQRQDAQRQDAQPRGQFGGDVNGYRSPMSDPAWSRGGRDGEYRAPGFRDARGTDDRRGGPHAGRGEYRAPAYRDDRGPRGNEYRAPAFGNDRGPRGNEYRAPAYRDDRGPRSDEYRAPAFGNDRGPRGGGPRDARQAPPRHGADGGLRRGPDRGRGGPRDDRGPRPDRPPRSDRQDRAPRSDRGPAGDRASHAGGQDRAPTSQERRGRRQAERPSYPITCAQCGAASEVPFKPQEGREILCRDCYRARKESAA